jgi:hypothetical protein
MTCLSLSNSWVTSSIPLFTLSSPFLAHLCVITFRKSYTIPAVLAQYIRTWALLTQLLAVPRSESLQRRRSFLQASTVVLIWCCWLAVRGRSCAVPDPCSRQPTGWHWLLPRPTPRFCCRWPERGTASFCPSLRSCHCCSHVSEPLAERATVFCLLMFSQYKK